MAAQGCLELGTPPSRSLKEKNLSKQSLMKRADALWYEYQHKQQRRCAICHEGGVEIHHIIPIGHKLTRFDRLNGLALCPFHHRISKLLSAHGSPDMFEDWLAEHLPEQYYYWLHNKDITGVSLTEDWYKAKIEELKLL